MVQDLGPGPAGRDFIRILKTHMKYGSELVGNAIKESLQSGSASADFVIALIDRARLKTTLPEPTDVAAFDQLAGIRVTLCPAPEQYQSLLATEGGVSDDDKRLAQQLFEASALTNDCKIV